MSDTTGKQGLHKRKGGELALNLLNFSVRTNVWLRYLKDHLH